MIKLSRKKDHRNHLVRNLVTSLILYESIKTTKAKAKETQKRFEKLFFKAKNNSLINRRYCRGYLYDKNAYMKLYDVLIPRYKSIKSGISTLRKYGYRDGDGSDMALLELTIKTEKIVNNKKEDENEK